MGLSSFSFILIYFSTLCKLIFFFILSYDRYDLNCTREWQKGCSSEYDQWKVLHEGAVDGGCKNIVEGREGTREICTVPSERFFHGAARFNDSTMLIYGGFSHR